MYQVLVRIVSKYQIHVRSNVISQYICSKIKIPIEIEIRTAVGPNASKDKEYKNPEYFCYHVDTIGEAEVELAKYRLPAPSNRRPFNK